MLFHSVQRCDALKTRTSATFRVSGKNVCKRDQGEWTDCKEVLSQGGGDLTLGLTTIIEKEWKNINNKAVYSISSPYTLTVDSCADGLNGHRRSVGVLDLFWFWVHRLRTSFFAG